MPTVTLTSISTRSAVIGDTVHLFGSNFSWPEQAALTALNQNGQVVHGSFAQGYLILQMDPTPLQIAQGTPGIRYEWAPELTSPFAADHWHFISDTEISVTLGPIVPTGSGHFFLIYNYCGATYLWQASLSAANDYCRAQTASFPIMISAAGTGPGPTGAVIPVVTAVTPNNGPLLGGNQVIISGSGFAGAIAISFGAQPVFSFQIPAAFSVDSDSQITVLSVPAGSVPGTVDVTVTNSQGDPSVASPGPDSYTYLPEPTITSLSPNKGPKAGGNTVWIAGTGFTGVTQVYFGGVPATALFPANDVSCAVTVPPAEENGVVDVQLVSPRGNSVISPADEYTYGVTFNGVDIYRVAVSSQWGVDDPSFGVPVRIAAGLPLAGPYTITDATPGSGITYQYYAVSYDAAGVGTQGATIESSIMFDVLFLHDVNDVFGTLNAYLFTPAERSDEYTQESAVLNFAGRTKPLAEFGPSTQRKVKIFLKMLTSSHDYHILRQMVRGKATICYRDSRGRRCFGIIPALPEQDALMTYETTLEMTEVDYNESV